MNGRKINLGPAVRKQVRDFFCFLVKTV